MYDERGAQHHSAHCNLRWPGGNAQVALLTAKVLAGPEPPRAAWELFNDYRDEALMKWEELNEEESDE